ncbi:MAG: 2Fe-2S iron-sulfur cluster-binding protein [Clostridium fessum]
MRWRCSGKKSSRRRDEIREYLAGNLCRCSGYEGQLRGILAFLDWKREKQKEAAE